MATFHPYHYQLYQKLLLILSRKTHALLHVYIVCATSFIGPCYADFRISQMPLLPVLHPPTLTMFVVSNVQALYAPAYDDASDINEDGHLDLSFQPQYRYYGYFLNDVCYRYQTNLEGQHVAGFEPIQRIADHTASCRYASGRWHGNFLNYLSMSRLDIIRKVLYGGNRLIDSASKKTQAGVTILGGHFAPQGPYRNGKTYTLGDVQNYSLAHFSPFDPPHSGTKHLFSTVMANKQPALRILLNTKQDLWTWLSIACLLYTSPSPRDA